MTLCALAFGCWLVSFLESFSDQCNFCMPDCCRNPVYNAQVRHSGARWVSRSGCSRTTSIVLHLQSWFHWSPWAAASALLS